MTATNKLEIEENLIINFLYLAFLYGQCSAYENMYLLRGHLHHLDKLLVTKEEQHYLQPGVTRSGL